MRYHIHFANPVSETDNLGFDVDGVRFVLAPGQSKLIEHDADNLSFDVTPTTDEPSEPVEQPRSEAPAEADAGEDDNEE